MNYTVVKVRKEYSSDSSHRHISGVITATGYFYTRRQVVDSINSGHHWRTQASGYSAEINVAAYCHWSTCLVGPYIKTVPNSVLKDNLENLPEG